MVDNISLYWLHQVRLTIPTVVWGYIEIAGPKRGEKKSNISQVTKDKNKPEKAKTPMASAVAPVPPAPACQLHPAVAPGLCGARPVHPPLL